MFDARQASGHHSQLCLQPNMKIRMDYHVQKSERDRQSDSDRATQRERDLIFPDPSVSCWMFCALLTADLIVLDGVALG